VIAYVEGVLVQAGREAIVAVAGLAVWSSVRSPRVGAVLRRSWIGAWLVASAALVVALATAPDGVVEIEAPQVRRSGGSPVPPEGTVARSSYRRGWRLDDGDRVVVPLRLRAGSGVVLEGWLLGTAQRRADLVVGWDDEPATVLRWRGGDPPERVVLPAPPDAGRHILEISFFSPPEGAVVLDRVVVRPSAGGQEPAGDS